MHNLIDYTDMPNRQERAIEDIRNWLGAERFELILEQFRAAPAPLEFEQFELLLGIAGVSGYPVRALHRHIWPEAAQ